MSKAAGCPSRARQLPDMTQMTAEDVPAQPSMLKSHWGAGVFGICHSSYRLVNATRTCLDGG
nr:hypothetical protein [Enterovibrio nigricans]